MMQDFIKQTDKTVNISGRLLQVLNPPETTFLDSDFCVANLLLDIL